MYDIYVVFFPVFSEIERGQENQSGGIVYCYCKDRIYVWELQRSAFNGTEQNIFFTITMKKKRTEGGRLEPG